MALDKISVKKGIEILKKIMPGANVISYENYDIFNQKEYDRVGSILCIDRKADGGYEKVIINILNFTEEQRELWEGLKNKVRYSSICRDLEDVEEVTRIGWF